MKKTLKIAAVVSACRLPMAIATSADATPYNSTFQISIYQGTGNGNISDPTQQANQSNPLITPTDLLASGTYTGPINFVQSGSGNGDIGTFLSSGGGTLSAGFLAAVSGQPLSASGFGLVSIFVITGDTFGHVLGGTISHDDGASLYDGAGYSNTVVDSAGPTSDIATTYAGLSGPFELIYAEANGLPADLNLDVTSNVGVPEPITLSLFGAGLAGAAAVRRRKTKKA